MAVINLLEMLPGDSQEITIDKINFNFDQILQCGGGPAGDPGPVGLTGPIGGPGATGLAGDDGEDGNKWYSGTGTPPAQPATPIYFEDDLYLDTATNTIWQFDGTFWFDTGDSLNVSSGEFKLDSVGSPGTGVILRDSSKNLILAPYDYDTISISPNSGFSAKLKIMNTPGSTFLEMGIANLTGSPFYENEVDHFIVNMFDNGPGQKDIDFNNQGGSVTLNSSKSITLSSGGGTPVSINTVVNIESTVGKYIGAIVDPTDMVNKGYVDLAIASNVIPGSINETLRNDGANFVSNSILQNDGNSIRIEQVGLTALTIGASSSGSLGTFARIIGTGNLDILGGSAPGVGFSPPENGRNIHIEGGAAGNNGFSVFGEGGFAAVIGGSSASNNKTVGFAAVLGGVTRDKGGNAYLVGGYGSPSGDAIIGWNPYKPARTGKVGIRTVDIPDPYETRIWGDTLIDNGDIELDPGPVSSKKIYMKHGVQMMSDERSMTVTKYVSGGVSLNSPVYMPGQDRYCDCYIYINTNACPFFYIDVESAPLSGIYTRQFAIRNQGTGGGSGGGNAIVPANCRWRLVGSQTPTAYWSPTGSHPVHYRRFGQ